MSCKKITFFVLIFLIWNPALLFGQYQDFFGVGSRQSSLGGAATALATDSSATYYNPAGLAFSRPIETAVTMEFLHMGGFKVSVANDSALAKKTEDLESMLGISLGFSMTFGGGKSTVKDEAIPCEQCGTMVRSSTTKCPVCGAEFEPESPKIIQGKPPQFALGINLTLPFKDLVTAEAVDATVPRLYFYESGIRKIAFFLGGAYRFSSWLSFGAGLSLMADANVSTDIQQPVNGGVNVDFKEQLRGDVAPIVGVRVQPIKGLWLGLTYRGEISLKVDALASTAIFGVSAFVLRIQAITLFSPHQIALGATYNLSPTLTALLDLTWYNWSRFRTTGTTAENQPGSLPITTETPPSIGTRDLVVPRIGLEWKLRKNWTARFGYTYYPAIVKAQRGITNLLDMDRHILTMGGGYRFSLLGFSNQLNVHFQLHILPTQKNTKSDPADFYGTTSAEGLIFTLGFTLKTDF